MIPKADLIKFCEDRLEAVRLRPLMFGGDWNGVETIIIDMLEVREWVRAYPEKPADDWFRRWQRAAAKAHRGGPISLYGRLEQDGITDDEIIREIYNAALNNYELDGVTPTEMLAKVDADENTYQRLSKSLK
jgi:hypothetical protein